MGNLLRCLRRRPEAADNAPACPAGSSTPAPETDNRRAPQTEASSLGVGEQGEGKRTDTAQAEETVSRPLGFRSPQERDVESRASGGNSEAAPSRQRGKPSTVPSAASGTVSVEGSQQDYLENLPRHDRRRIQQEMRRKRKPGN